MKWCLRVRSVKKCLERIWSAFFWVFVLLDSIVLDINTSVILFDNREYDESDEFCPHCDNHYVIEAKTPTPVRFTQISVGKSSIFTVILTLLHFINLLFSSSVLKVKIPDWYVITVRNNVNTIWKIWCRNEWVKIDYYIQKCFMLIYFLILFWFVVGMMMIIN